MLGSDVPGGQRSDSIAIVRVDPSSDRMDVLSIPRDLWVDGADGEKHRINEAFNGSSQDLIDVIDKNLGIPIHHYVEVDFVGFREIIDALGGVPMYFDTPVRDPNSGLHVENPGCVVLNGEGGLAFARSRNLQWSDGVEWNTDGSGDLGRITRQQLLMRAAMDQARTLGLNNVGTLTRLVDAGVNATTIDSGLGIGDITALGKHFADVDSQNLQSHALAVTPHRTSGGAAVVLLDEQGSAGTLAMFRGTAEPTAVTTTTVPPPSAGDIEVDVLNAGAPDGEARRVSYVFTDGGFRIGVVDTAAEQDATTVSHAPGGEAMGELVAGWLDPAPEVQEDADLEPGTVVVRIGPDFQHVFEPDEAPETTTTAPDTTETSAAGGNTPTTTTTTAPGWTPGVAPQGVSCSKG
jgi:LCP family protein required for cell wall assembly